MGRGPDRFPRTLRSDTRSDEVRFLERTDRSGACWLWLAGCNPEGYGKFHTRSGRSVETHRWAYETFVGPVPVGLVLDHLCRVRHCVNPAHLEPVTDRENILRSPIAPAAINARKTHCPRGHGYTPENTTLGSSGKRFCRACNREAVRRYKARKQQH